MICGQAAGFSSEISAGAQLEMSLSRNICIKFGCYDCNWKVTEVVYNASRLFPFLKKIQYTLAFSILSAGWLSMPWQP